MSSDLRVLHLFSNYKWTGPADPAIRCAVRLRALGADVVFAQAQWTLPGAEHRMRRELARSHMPVTGDLSLRKHFHPPSLLRDVRALRRRLQRGDFDLLHTHLLGDHLLAALARRAVPRRVVVVRSLYEPRPPRRDWRLRMALRRTDGVVAPTAACGREVVQRLGLPSSSVLVQEPPVEPVELVEDGERRRATRDALGIPQEAVAIGITARIQPHRRFELLWEVAQDLVARHPHVHFVLLGRGNEEDTRRLVQEPITRLGLADHVSLPGYLYDGQYRAALAALDQFVFLVPGSDGTCRAVREAMAHGLPVVATRRGMLPAILDADGETPCGVVCDEEPGAVAAALARLVEEPAARQQTGARARAKAVGAMDPVAAARRLRAFYGELWERAGCR